MAKAKAKRKTLPKDFEALLEKSDLGELKAALEPCDPNAYGGFGKRTALAFAKCPDELTRWLVERGANLNAEDTWGKTPLHNRITFRGNFEILVDLGADIHHVSRSLGTPLHDAADRKNLPAATLLLDRGARVDAPNQEGRTPLELALQRCGSIDIPNMLALAKLLVSRGAQKRPSMQAAVRRIGEEFEFHRANFNPDLVGEVSAGLDGLYALFEVQPVARRVMHDGNAPI